MNATLVALREKLTGRLARNIYLWASVLWFVFSNGSDKRSLSTIIYYEAAICTTLVLTVLTCFNNFIIIPRTLARKKYGTYLLFALLNILFFGTLYSLTVKYFISHYPGLLVGQISLISEPVNTKWDISTIFEEAMGFDVAFVFWIFIMTMSWYMNDYLRQQKILEQVQQKQLTTELYFLKNQINPHFLFNTLNNLYGLALKKSDSAPDAILRLSEILRYLLYDSNTDFVDFDKEKSIIDAYIALELLRLPPDKNLTFHVEADKHYKIPPLLWLPVLENIFKHATRVITEHYYIDFSFTIKMGQLHIFAKNNYKTDDNTNGNDAGGIGLDNLRKRLALIYPDKHSINIEKDHDYYTIDIKTDIS